jgi:hypothetical protein
MSIVLWRMMTLVPPKYPWMPSAWSPGFEQIGPMKFSSIRMLFPESRGPSLDVRR